MILEWIYGQDGRFGLESFRASWLSPVLGVAIQIDFALGESISDWIHGKDGDFRLD